MFSAVEYAANSPGEQVYVHQLYFACACRLLQAVAKAAGGHTVIVPGTSHSGHTMLDTGAQLHRPCVPEVAMPGYSLLGLLLYLLHLAAAW
jgi:hypothetical protein